jgi:hypothetical protein
MPLNKLLLATPWKEVLMYSDPSPNAEKIDLATDANLWKVLRSRRLL